MGFKFLASHRQEQDVNPLPIVEHRFVSAGRLLGKRWIREAPFGLVTEAESLAEKARKVPGELGEFHAQGME